MYLTCIFSKFFLLFCWGVTFYTGILFILFFYGFKHVLYLKYLPNSKMAELVFPECSSVLCVWECVHVCTHVKYIFFNRLSINNLFLHMLLDRDLTFFLITNKSFQCSLLNSSACLLLWNTFLSWFESPPYYRQNSYAYLCLFPGFLIFFLELCFSILIIVTSYFAFLFIGENHRRNRQEYALSLQILIGCSLCAGLHCKSLSVFSNLTELQRNC